MSVSGVPYVHWKIINEKQIQDIDFNYTWATTVESTKGPINTPVFVTDADEAKQVFNINMDGYFAQSPRALIMVRVAESSPANILAKGVYNFTTKEDIVFCYADQYKIEIAGEKVPVYYVVKENPSTHAKERIPVIQKIKDGDAVYQTYVDKWDSTTGEADDDATDYTAGEILNLMTAVKKTIPAGTSLIKVSSRYEGDTGALISTQPSLIGTGYNISIQEPEIGTIAINNMSDVIVGVNRINSKSFNLLAEPTVAGQQTSLLVNENPKAVEFVDITLDSETISAINEEGINVSEMQLLKIKKSASGEISALTSAEEEQLQAYKKNPTGTAPTFEEVAYGINLKSEANKTLVGGNAGAWNYETNRINTDYQSVAHEAGLKTLRKMRLAGVFCMYGEDSIINEYIKHGINPQEPEKGMNNDETCKWRSILVGANNYDRSDISTFCIKSEALNNQYVLYLGQGLIDTGMKGVAYNMTDIERQRASLCSPHHLLPYECTQYIAGLRSKLDYGESIFGGQGRKRIRGVGELSIAPLLKEDDIYTWEPKNIVTLNEAGVLTFTEDYGQISITDGVTTSQKTKEEDEEGVMNILKYAQNVVYDVCLPYIGRNITNDLQISLKSEIESALDVMEKIDKTLISLTDEGIQAYEVEVVTTPRNVQLVGKIQVVLKITPVHALRQIEVEMTVQ